MQKHGSSLIDILQDTSQQGPHPSHLGGVNVHVLPATPTVVPAYMHRQPRTKALSADLDQRLRQVRSRLLDNAGLRTANSARATGNSSHSLTFPSYSGPGHFPQASYAAGSTSSFGKVAGLAALFGLVLMA